MLFLHSIMGILVNVSKTFTHVIMQAGPSSKKFDTEMNFSHDHGQDFESRGGEH